MVDLLTQSSTERYVRGHRPLNPYLENGVSIDGLIWRVIVDPRFLHSYHTIQSARALLSSVAEGGGLHVVFQGANIFLGVSSTVMAYVMGALTPLLELVCAESWEDALAYYGDELQLLADSGGTLVILVALLQQGVRIATPDGISSRRMVAAWCDYPTLVRGLQAHVSLHSPFVLAPDSHDYVSLADGESRQAAQSYFDVLDFVQRHPYHTRGVNGATISSTEYRAYLIPLDRLLASMDSSRGLSDEVLDGAPVQFRALVAAFTTRRLVAARCVFDNQGDPRLYPLMQNFLPEDNIAALHNGQPVWRRALERAILAIQPGDSSARVGYVCHRGHRGFFAPVEPVPLLLAPVVPLLPPPQVVLPQPVVPVGFPAPLAPLPPIAAYLPVAPFPMFPAIAGAVGAVDVPVVVGELVPQIVPLAVMAQLQAVEVNMLLVNPTLLSDDDMELQTVLSLEHRANSPALRPLPVTDLLYSAISDVYVAPEVSVVVSTVDLKFKVVFGNPIFEVEHIVGSLRAGASSHYVIRGAGADAFVQTNQARGAFLQLPGAAGRNIVYSIFHNGNISAVVGARGLGASLTVHDIEAGIFRGEVDIPSMIKYDFNSMLDALYRDPHHLRLLCEPGMASRFIESFDVTIDADDGEPMMVSGRPFVNLRGQSPYQCVELQSILISPLVRSSTPFDLLLLDAGFRARACNLYGTIQGAPGPTRVLTLLRAFWPVINGACKSIKLVVYAGRRGIVTVKPKLEYGKGPRSLDFTPLAPVFSMWMALLVDAGYSPA